MSTSPHTQAIDTINNLNAYRLARIADTAPPDALGSPGAQFLTTVRDSLVEWVEYNRDEDIETLGDRAANEALIETLGARAQDDALEQVDSTVPAYTHQLWQTFIDLAAYTDEASDEFEGGDMTDGASYILARIAERLFMALAGEYVAAYGNGEGDD